MGNVKEEIAKNLLFYRKKNGLTQKQFAELLGVKGSSVSNWENGTNSIDIETLFNACGILNVDINKMYGVDDSNDFDCSKHEKNIIISYRNHPEMQDAVDKLLGVEPQPTGTIRVYRAAKSSDNHPDEIIDMPIEQWKKLKDAPSTDDKLM